MCQLGDPPYFIHIKTVTPRKRHKCDECGSIIEIGEKHEYVSAMWDRNSFGTVRTCDRCVEARRWLEVVCRSWLYEGVHEDLDEHAFEYDQWHLGIVANAMHRKWYHARSLRRFTVAEIRKLVDASIKDMRRFGAIA